MRGAEFTACLWDLRGAPAIYHLWIRRFGSLKKRTMSKGQNLGRGDNVAVPQWYCSCLVAQGKYSNTPKIHALDTESLFMCFLQTSAVVPLGICELRPREHASTRVTPLESAGKDSPNLIQQPVRNHGLGLPECSQVIKPICQAQELKYPSPKVTRHARLTYKRASWKF
jgi:hypothetical protein